MYGIHDWDPAWGSLLKAENVRGWCVTTHALTVQRAHDFRDMAAYNVTPIARLNWGYGTTGTIPLPKDYNAYAEACANFVRESTGCNIWQVGNEPNHPQEWPDNQRISPDEYIQCYRLARIAIKRVSPDAIVMPAPIAPWTVAVGLGWIEYFQYVLSQVEADAISIHAYTRGADPNAITSDAKMDPPFQQYHSGFRCYRDFLAAIPSQHRSLPVHITEFDENEPWTDANTGVVQAAYREIHNWNQQSATQKIHSLSLFRWPAFDKRWHIEGKQGVIADFKAALQQRYSLPPTAGGSTTLYVPVVSSQTEGSSPSVSPPVQWDPRLDARGVKIVPTQGSPYWRVSRVQWLNEQESQGRYHIYAHVLDEAGNPLYDVPLKITWPDGEYVIHTEDKPAGEYTANYPMGKSLKEYSISVADGMPSETVTGIGRGDYGNPNVHTSTIVVFQRAQRGGAQPVQSKSQVPALTHPVADERYRIVTQEFRANPQAYSQFKIDGVPLQGHNGVDFGTPVGTSVVAVAQGRVVEVADEGTRGYGKYIKLEHPWGESLYAHLSDQFVSVGQNVQPGQPLGRSGNTGNSTGPHLHFGLRVAPFNRRDGMGGFSDPLPYLKGSTVQTSQDIWSLCQQAGQEFGIEPELLASLTWAESSWRPQAVSPVGAQGLGQIMPTTWSEWAPQIRATNPFHPLDNLRVTAAYLRWLREATQGSLLSALYAYNWGIGNVLSGASPPAETVIYGHKVIHGRDLLVAMRR